MLKNAPFPSVEESDKNISQSTLLSGSTTKQIFIWSYCPQFFIEIHPVAFFFLIHRKIKATKKAGPNYSHGIWSEHDK